MNNHPIPDDLTVNISDQNNPPQDLLGCDISCAVDSALRPLFDNSGYDVEDIVATRSSDESFSISIFLDKDGGVTIDDLSTLHQGLLDSFNTALISYFGSEPLYEIRLCSRGIDAPLTHTRHWRRNIGRKVNITLADKTKISGRIGQLSPDNSTITIVVADKSRLIQKHIALTDVSRAIVDVDFREPNPRLIEFCRSGGDFNTTLNATGE